MPNPAREIMRIQDRRAALGSVPGQQQTISERSGWSSQVTGLGVAGNPLLGGNVILVPGGGVTMVQDPASGRIIISASGSGGGGVGYPRHDPDEPPAIPSQWDDEFTGTLLDPKWSTLNVHGEGGFRQGELISMLSCRGGHEDVMPLALLQPAPSGPWTITAKVINAQQYLGATSTDKSAFVGLAVAPAEAVGDALDTWMLGRYSNAYSYLRSEQWSTPTSWKGSKGTYTYYSPSGYLRVVWDGAALSHWHSPDGLGWYRWTAPYDPGWTPGRIGIAVRGAVGPSYVDWFRVTTS